MRIDTGNIVFVTFRQTEEGIETGTCRISGGMLHSWSGFLPRAASVAKIRSSLRREIGNRKAISRTMAQDTKILRFLLPARDMPDVLDYDLICNLSCHGSPEARKAIDARIARRPWPTFQVHAAERMAAAFLAGQEMTSPSPITAVPVR